MRLPKQVVKEREDYALSLFKTNPGITVPKANQALRDRDGKAMNLARLYELREKAKRQAKREAKKKAAAAAAQG